MIHPARIDSLDTVDGVSDHKKRPNVSSRLVSCHLHRIIIANRLVEKDSVQCENEGGPVDPSGHGVDCLRRARRRSRSRPRLRALGNE